MGGGGGETWQFWFEDCSTEIEWKCPWLKAEVGRSHTNSRRPQNNDEQQERLHGHQLLQESTGAWGSGDCGGGTHLCVSRFIQCDFIDWATGSFSLLPTSQTVLGQKCVQCRTFCLSSLIPPIFPNTFPISLFTAPLCDSLPVLKKKMKTHFVSVSYYLIFSDWQWPEGTPSQVGSPVRTWTEPSRGSRISRGNHVEFVVQQTSSNSGHRNHLAAWGLLLPYHGSKCHGDTGI